MKAKKSRKTTPVPIIKKKTSWYNTIINTGYVSSVIDGVAIIRGLKNVKLGETLNFVDKNKNNITILSGMALNLNESSVSAVLFGDERLIKPGTKVIGKGVVISVPVGTNLLGRVVDSLGCIIDGLEPLKNIV